MLGRKITEEKLSPSSKKELLLELKTKALNIQFYKGEILGIAGVEGNGQSELMNLLISPAKFKIDGDLVWKDKSVKKFDALKMRKLGLRFLPEDRLHQGCLITADLKDNFIFGQQRSKNFQKWNFLKKKEIQNQCLKALKNFDVRPQDSNASFSKLSGGNQQKLVVARELSQEPEFLIAAQPTRGVDIGASQKIHRELIQERTRNASVVLISSELDEVLKLSDRILVMFQGKIAGEISNWSSLSEVDQQSKIKQIGNWMVGNSNRIDS